MTEPDDIRRMAQERAHARQYDDAGWCDPMGATPPIRFGRWAVVAVALVCVVLILVAVAA